MINKTIHPFKSSDMNTNVPARELPAALEGTIASLYKLVQAFSDKGLNIAPSKGSWSAAQVADHITKSTYSIAQALDLPGTAAGRDPEERAPELRDMFLDFKIKFKSPDFILPGQEVYKRGELMTALEQSFSRLKETAFRTDLSESISHPAFGAITKLELLHFVVYHTQRHMHQLQQIYRHTEQKPYKFLSFLFAPLSLF